VLTRYWGEMEGRSTLPDLRKCGALQVFCNNKLADGSR